MTGSLLLCLLICMSGISCKDRRFSKSSVDAVRSEQQCIAVQLAKDIRHLDALTHGDTNRVIHRLVEEIDFKIVSLSVLHEQCPLDEASRALLVSAINYRKEGQGLFSPTNSIGGVPVSSVLKKW